MMRPLRNDGAIRDRRWLSTGDNVTRLDMADNPTTAPSASSLSTQSNRPMTPHLPPDTSRRTVPACRITTATAHAKLKTP